MSQHMLPEHEDTVIAILRRAYGYLRRGWCQHYEAAVATGGPWSDGSPDLVAVEYLEPTATHFCIMGAINRAAADLGQGWLADFANARVQQTFKHRGSQIPIYNDRKGRRKETIMRRMEKAIGGK